MKLVTKQSLEHKYLEEGKTIYQVADELGLREAMVRDSKIRIDYLKAETFCSTGRLRGAMLWLFGENCSLLNCNYSKFVDVHHIEGKNYRGKGNVRMHTQNKISKAVLLCPNHHREADNGLIPIETLRETIKTRKLKT